MHWVKGVVGVNKNTTTQHYSMCSAKVVWGLWVLGLHEEAHQPRARDDLSGPLPFGKIKIKINNRRSTIGRSHPFIFTNSMKDGHMNDQGLKD